MAQNEIKKVTIIDYQLGNLFSVEQACNTIGLNAKISSKKEDIINADALILPGVGAFIEAMKNLKNLDLISPIKDAVQQNKPIFGICLGQQLLFSESEEFGSGKGLDIIPGRIRKFSKEMTTERIKVPQIAWNKVYQFQKSWKDTALCELKDGEYMYFVHSYFVSPETEDSILTKTNYCGVEYCSAIQKNNIFATQFHPEKSSTKGISIYRNWGLKNQLL
jgi:imidazole glycerol-phosphate synthase subunit HisH